MKQPPKHTVLILAIGLAFSACRLLVDPEFALSTYRLLADSARPIIGLDRLLLNYIAWLTDANTAFIITVVSLLTLTVATLRASHCTLAGRRYKRRFLVTGRRR